MIRAGKLNLPKIDTNMLEEPSTDYTFVIPTPKSLYAEQNLVNILDGDNPAQDISFFVRTVGVGASPTGQIIPKRNIFLATQVLIKPARKTPDFYVSEFPDSLYCQPYKYDVLVRIPTLVYQASSLSIGLLDAETGEKISLEKPSINVERVTETHLQSGESEILFRLYFTLCSFHYNKKQFRFTVQYVSHLDKSVHTVYTSAPFSTFARKSKEMDVWTSRPKRKIDEIDVEHRLSKRDRIGESDELEQLESLV